MKSTQNMTIGRMHARPLQVAEIDEVVGGRIHWTGAQITTPPYTVDVQAGWDFDTL